MAMQNDNGFKAFAAGAALAAYRVVKINAAGAVVYPAAFADRTVGVTQNAVASGANVTVKLWNAPGTFKVTAGVAVTAADGGQTIYHSGTAADGKVRITDGGSQHLLGVALEAVTTDGMVLEMTPVPVAP